MVASGVPSLDPEDSLEPTTLGMWRVVSESVTFCSASSCLGYLCESLDFKNLNMYEERQASVMNLLFINMLNFFISMLNSIWEMLNSHRSVL